MQFPFVDSLGSVLMGAGYIINLAGVIIVIWGFVVSVKAFVLMKVRGHGFHDFFAESSRIRALLGTYILFGLEFMIAADILHTFIKPDLYDLLVLGIVVVIRTVVSYFLAKEVDEARHDKPVRKNTQKA